MATEAKTQDDILSAKKKNKDPKNCGLKKCFSALVDRKQVNLELEVLRLMLRKELQINLDSLQPDLANILPYLLVYYIKNWPGWQKSVEYYSGNIPFKSWYEKFHKFITIKLNEAIKTHYRDAMNDLQADKNKLVSQKYASKHIIDRNTQTDSLAPKVPAPFTIDIKAKPVLLNTIVFTDTPDGDVILKQHSVLEWDKSVSESITLKQIITWPHVGVHMSSPIFSFSRRNLHEFRRYISLAGTPLPPSNSNFVEEVELIDPKLQRHCYSLDYIRDMTKEFMLALGNVYTSPAVLEAFQTVIEEFLTDIAEFKIPNETKPTMASNTRVLFNIGRNTYFRNKKLSKGNNPSRFDLGYTEAIIPKMETTLAYLTRNSDQIKAYLKSLKNFTGEGKNNEHHILPQITFSCSYCQVNFENGGLLAAHLIEEHKMEQPVLCSQCKKSFLAVNLTKVRWSHTCTVPPKIKPKLSN